MEASLIKIARHDTTFYAENRADIVPVVVLCRMLKSVFGVDVTEPKIERSGNGFDANLSNFLICVATIANKPCPLEVTKTIVGCVTGLTLKDSNDETLESWVKGILYG